MSRLVGAPPPWVLKLAHAAAADFEGSVAELYLKPDPAQTIEKIGNLAIPQNSGQVSYPMGFPGNPMESPWNPIYTLHG